jgi:hypothetical protein
MGPLDLAVKLRRPWLDVDVLHAQVSHVPMEERLELVAAIRSDRADSKRELFHDVVDAVDRIRPCVALVYLECSDSRGVIDRRVLIAPNGRSLPSRKRDELRVYLHVLARNLLLAPVRVHGASSDSVRNSGQAMLLTDSVDRCIRDFDVVIALEIPGNADRPNVVGPS